MIIPTVIIFVILDAVLGLGRAGEMQAAVQEVFMEVLGLHPPNGHNIRAISPPKHMLALYHKYVSGKGKHFDVPDTVRNILPIKGPPSLADLVLFNVSCLDEGEEVSLGQLHLNRRRLHQRHFSRRVLAPPYRVRVYKVTGNRLSSMGSVPVPQVNRAAWHAVDITAPLRELLLGSRNSQLLGIRFEAPRGKPMTPKHFLRSASGSSASFLVVFSERSLDNDISDDGEILKKEQPLRTHDLALKIQSVTKGKWMEESDDVDIMFSDISVPSDSTLVDKAVTKNTSPFSPDGMTTEVATTKLSLINEQLTDKRQRRSIEDNELPEMEPYKSNMILAKEHNIIPIPNRRRKGRRGNNGKKRNKKTKSDSKESWNTASQRSTDSSDSSGVCRLQKLKVNFADIGWDNWILAPDTFEANYCTGSCSYPINKDVKATNHAALQSLVHLLGKTIPPPTCAPDELGSTGFLFLDEVGNTIIKNYPNMRVESCSCR
ncbi:growth/differentiation factor 10-like [Lycorma delicatula]|uniref:growth/differentiation factor 10-like n=1 Tax=Lycorma delicatula TaxID=130591 RepID=UPI003F5104B1